MNNMEFIDGMNKAWDLAFRLIGEDKDVLLKMFGTDEVDEIISNNEPQYVLKKLEEYDNENRKEYVPDTNVGNKDGWISVDERLPEEHDSIFKERKGTDKWIDAMFEKTSDEVIVTVEYENGERRTKITRTIDGEWNTGQSIVPFKVIAWQPLPAPYKEKGE